ncbi:MAG: glycosyltransferase [Candidatus Margulisiibacteriota bacterium]
MRIAQINKLYSPWIGGIESHVQVLAEGLAHRGHNVSVLCCQPKGERVTDQVNGIPVIRAASMGMFWGMPVSLSFARELSEWSVDVVHIHLPNPLATLAYLKVRPQGKLIVTWHSAIVRQRMVNAAYRPFLQRFLGLADRILVTSPQLAHHAKDLFPWRDRTAIVPLGIPLERYRYTQELHSKIEGLHSQHGRFALFVGRLVYYKGIEVLLRALAGTPIKMVIVGDGPLRDLCLTHLQHNPNLVLVPPQDEENLRAYFAASSFLVLPSVAPSEAFGIVQVEAMAYGKPIISTDLPTGVPYVNQNGVTGIVVPPKDVTELRHAMLRFWHHPDLCEDRGERARQRAYSYFGAETMLEKIEGILHNL